MNETEKSMKRQKASSLQALRSSGLEKNGFDYLKDLEFSKKAPLDNTYVLGKTALDSELNALLILDKQCSLTLPETENDWIIQKQGALLIATHKIKPGITVIKAGVRSLKFSHKSIDETLKILKASVKHQKKAIFPTQVLKPNTSNPSKVSKEKLHKLFPGHEEFSKLHNFEALLNDIAQELG